MYYLYMKSKKALYFSLVACGLLILSLIYAHFSGIVRILPHKIIGIDVSSHQGEIDWNRVVSAGIKFSYIKATEANDFIDKKFQANWNSAQSAGIIVGAYHYYSLAYEGEVQAENFIRTVPVIQNQLPPVIDLEYAGNSKERPTKDGLQKQLLIYIKLIKERYGKEPIIYTTSAFYDDYLSPEFQNKVFWKRNLFYKPQNWTFWQYSQWGLVEGIDGRVDLNYFNGNEVSLRSLLD